MSRGRSSRLTELTLGMRMSVSGGRSGWARLALVATGIGIGVAMLLLVASVPNVLDTRATRDAARSPGTPVAERGDDTILVKRMFSEVGAENVVGHLLQPEGPRAPLPPGVDRSLAPGEALLSPALLRLLEGPGGDVLEGRWGDRVVGTIAPDGLVGPQELRVYVGTDQLTEANATRVDRFGKGLAGAGGTDAAGLLVALVGLTALLVPVAGFITTAVRFGGESRDRRLAAVRLVGADAATTRRIAAGETLVGALGGLVVGAALFAAVRAVIPPLIPPSLSFHGDHLRPAPALAALVAVLVPVASVLVTRSALRHVVVEPLGVVRRSTVVRRRLWWRVALPVAGLALLVLPLVTGGRGAYVGDGQQLVLPGMVLLLVGVALLLPWFVDVTVHRLRPGGLAWDLAVRRLQLESGTAVRAVSAVVVSVASLIAMHGMLAADMGMPGLDGDRFEAQVYDDRPGSNGAQWATELAGTAGVVGVETQLIGHVEPVADGEAIMLVVGSCAAFTSRTGVPGCADGDAMVVAPPGADAPAAGTAYVVGEPGSPTWTLPADTATVEPTEHEFEGPPAYLFATPGALADAGVVPSDSNFQANVVVVLDRDVEDAAEHVRTAVAKIDPSAMVAVNDPEAISPMGAAIRQGLLLGTVALLTVVGASLLVNVAEQLRERRRPLAVLAAFGTRRSTLGLSVLYQVTVPVALGLTLAVVVGAGLALLLQAGSGMPLSIDWAGITFTASGAAIVVLLATAATLPLVGRLTRPTGLQGE
ncbi:FtsX-like permease family protein [Cellulomonas fengjieae]|uniref:ABC transporter permease n=1 Tax=Cellulomonas fengjieae TaxID=2819978 RepID=A0ABS3SC58_9CELL|nr:ABC transporter permease [Cellulomonas fengjieae]MBO3083335.1 ABC transporter permease [Cellulomonas fengjieae]QVI65320.1 ABC transporter permease [Cellulomonas fengjieae]